MGISTKNSEILKIMPPRRKPKDGKQEQENSNKEEKQTETKKRKNAKHHGRQKRVKGTLGRLHCDDGDCPHDDVRRCKVQCGVTGCDHSDTDSCWIMRQELMSSSGDDHRVGALSQQRTLLSIGNYRKKKGTVSGIPRVVGVPASLSDYMLACLGATLMSKVLGYTRHQTRE